MIPMMWKRSIVQARVAVALLLLATGVGGADLVIELPGGGAADGGHYRLDYEPPQGSPAPNHTVPARPATINFQGLPGTKYHFMLYYSNASFADLLTWNRTIVTAPEPPADLTVAVPRSKQATVSWSPPSVGAYTGFRFRVIPLSGAGEEPERNLTAPATPPFSLTLRELAPGAVYTLHAFTLLHDKESAAYASHNFTTKPNTPGKFIVWFRNETTLLVLWQPPYPPGAYSHYKVSIVPPDARDSELYVEKEGEPPGPAQAAFKGLVPGRAYNISVQTVAEPEISAPTTAQYRTVPLRPAEPALLERGETWLKLRWAPPRENSEFERYQVALAPALGAARRPPPLLVPRHEPLEARFDQLEPGASYTASVKTMSGKVTSWPATLDATTRPLPVRNVTWALDASGAVQLQWEPAPGSTQDAYNVTYVDVSPSRGEDSGWLSSAVPSLRLEALLPGRNYSVRVAAVSRGVLGAGVALGVATRPLAPALREAKPEARALALAWSADVDSRQDEYELSWQRLEPAELPAGAEERKAGTLRTRAPHATLEPLFPGALYEVALRSVSHGLVGPQLRLVLATRPLPPRNVSAGGALATGAVVRWVLPPPEESAVGELLLRFRTEGAGAWTRLPPVQPHHPEAEILDLTPGERYTIQLETLSLGGGAAGGERVESGAGLSATRAVPPAPVTDVAPRVDAHNLTLEWPRTAGRVERYSLAWWPLGRPGAARNVSLVAPASGPVKAQLAQLRPGAAYSVAIAAHSYDLVSDLFTMDTRTRPVIQSEMTIVTEPGDGEEDGSLPSLLVQFTRTPASAAEFDAYRLVLEAADAPQPLRAERTLQADAEPARAAFAGLTPGALYNVTLATVSGGVASGAVTRQARLFPRAPRDLKALEVGARALLLTWAPGGGKLTDYEVQWLEGERLQARAAPESQLRLEGLRPFSNYTFSVEARAGHPASLLTRSRAVSVSVATLEAEPDAPLRFQPVDAKPTEMTFTWSLPPEHRHGALLGFTLTCAEEGSTAAAAAAAVTLTLEADAERAAVRGLRPGLGYACRLWGATRAGQGAAAEWRARTPIAAPPRPPPHAAPQATRRTPTTVAVSFRSDLFSSANGNVTAYTLVVGEEARDAAARLPAWRDVHALPVWPPYQVTEPYFPFRASAVEEFVIGDERCELAAHHYCNGPLKPATKYYVKLRAFTAPDKFTDTGYTVVYTDVEHTAWAAGGGAAGAVLLLAGAGALLLRRRRKQRAPSAPAPRLSRPVRVADFRDHYRLMSADSDFRFSEEFEELKHVGRDQPCTAADLPVNRPKNRFTNILPYDHSRYKLQPVDDEEGSDYINANYVPGQRSPREFIVTQGPLHCTRDDFWRMCWESGTRCIVMLTRCVEKGREKCDRYWPADARPVAYGDIAVTALTEQRFPDWTVTELRVVRGGEARGLLHLHFTTWPDFGVPAPPTTLARFVRAFRERVPPEAAPRPTVVHCSAGVGRSGTFVTLDRALQLLDAGALELDVFGMVAALRRERVWMVQTEQQYICVHQCVAAVLDGAPLEPPHTQHHHNLAYDDDEGIVESGM